MSDPLNSFVSGPVADTVLNERRRFRVLWGTTGSTARDRLGGLGEEVIEMGEWGLEDRSARAAVGLDVAVDVAKSAI